MRDMIPNPFTDEPSTPIDTKSQLKAYKRRKNLLFMRMKFGTILMCIVVIFLAWLQDWLPNKNRQFWDRGMSFL